MFSGLLFGERWSAQPRLTATVCEPRAAAAAAAAQRVCAQMTGADWLVRGERRDFVNEVARGEEQLRYEDSVVNTVTLIYIQNFFQNTNELNPQTPFKSHTVMFPSLLRKLHSFKAELNL